MTEYYAVIGNPIAHSKSPLIHAAFAQQTSQDMSYESIKAPLDGFADTIKRLVAEGYRGVNVTVPFKFEAFRLANHRHASSVVAEASNTLAFRDEGIVAYNTDGVGLVKDIERNLHTPLYDKKILMLGAGGAAQGVAENLADKQPALFVVANRSLDKVLAMQQKIEDAREHPVTSITAAPFDGLDGMEFDVVINATSTGLSNVALPIPPTIFAENCLAYDMMYGVETPFMTQAKVAGAQVADGLGMLVEQAAAAFYQWRGVYPVDTQAVIDQMRA